MNKLANVLITACGCPGGPSVIRALQKQCHVYGVDSDPCASGRFFTNFFEAVPEADDPAYLDALLGVCQRAKPDVLLPQSSTELEVLAENVDAFKPIVVMVSGIDSVRIALDKWLTYKTLEGIAPMPRHRLVHTPAELTDAAVWLGFQRLPVVVKTRTGKGGRGFRVLRAGASRMALDMRTWPNSQIVTLTEALEGPYPLLVMEYLQGDESSADTFDAYNAEFGFTKIRADCRMGLHHQHVAKWDPWLWQQGINIVKALGLQYFANVQFMDGKLLEVNPRISTCLYPSGYNYPLAGVRAALGLDPDIGAMPDGARFQYYTDGR